MGTRDLAAPLSLTFQDIGAKEVSIIMLIDSENEEVIIEEQRILRSEPSKDILRYVCIISHKIMC